MWRMFTIKQAAERVGISAELLRAWEKRYGVVEPSRTSGGYRLYGPLEIERLRTMRALVDSGWRPREAAQHVLTASGPKEYDTLQAFEALPESPGSSPHVQGFLRAALEYDAARLGGILNDIGASADFEGACDQHLFPCLRALGDAWAAGGLSVASEHFATATVHRWLGKQFEAAARERSVARAIVGLPPGARHELGALAFAVGLRRAGIPTLFLGSDVPVEAWVEAVSPRNISFVAIGSITPADVANAELVAGAVRSARADAAIALGGASSAGLERCGTVLPPGLTDALRVSLGILHSSPGAAPYFAAMNG